MKKIVIFLVICLGLHTYTSAQKSAGLSLARIEKNAIEKEKEVETTTITVTKEELPNTIKNLKADGWTITEMHKNKDGSTTITGERQKIDGNNKNLSPNITSHDIPDGTFVGKVKWYGKYLEIADTYKDGVIVKITINGEEFSPNQWPQCLEKFK